MEKAIKRYFPIFVLPTMLAFTIGFIAPFLLGVYLSFCKFTTVTDAKFIGLANYVKIFAENDFTHSLIFTVLFTIVTVLLINVLAFAVAMLLTKGFKGTNVFRTVFFMPNLIGGIILGYVWQLLLNGILAMFDRTLTYSATYGFWGLVILTLTNGFKLFDQNLALTNGAPSKASEMLALNIYNTFYGRTGYEGVGQAKAVIFFIIVTIIAMVQNRLTTSKEVQQ